MKKSWSRGFCPCDHTSASIRWWFGECASQLGEVGWAEAQDYPSGDLLPSHIWGSYAPVMWPWPHTFSISLGIILPLWPSASEVSCWDFLSGREPIDKHCQFCTCGGFFCAFVEQLFFLTQIKTYSWQHEIFIVLLSCTVMFWSSTCCSLLSVELYFSVSEFFGGPHYDAEVFTTSSSILGCSYQNNWHN